MGLHPSEVSQDLIKILTKACNLTSSRSLATNKSGNWIPHGQIQLQEGAVWKSHCNFQQLYRPDRCPAGPLHMAEPTISASMPACPLPQRVGSPGASKVPKSGHSRGCVKGKARPRNSFKLGRNRGSWNQPPSSLDPRSNFFPSLDDSGA